jgi:hypothetical protein
MSNSASKRARHRLRPCLFAQPGGSSFDACSRNTRDRRGARAEHAARDRPGAEACQEAAVASAHDYEISPLFGSELQEAFADWAEPRLDSVRDPRSAK